MQHEVKHVFQRVSTLRIYTVSGKPYSVFFPPHPQDISFGICLALMIHRKGGEEYKKTAQKKEQLTERSLEIVSYDRAVVVKLNCKGWVTNVTVIATGFGSKGE